MPPTETALTAIEIRILTQVDAPVLDRVAPDVFDELIDANWSAELLADPRHHFAVALADDLIVGMGTAEHYVNPDKRARLRPGLGTGGSVERHGAPAI